MWQRTYTEIDELKLYMNHQRYDKMQSIKLELKSVEIIFRYFFQKPVSFRK